MEKIIINPGDKFTIDEYPGIVFSYFLDTNNEWKIFVVSGNKVGQIVRINDNNGKIYIQ